MVDIIGTEATNRSSNLPINNTYIVKNNPASVSGSVTTVKIWADNSEKFDVVVGTFYSDESNIFRCRDFETLVAPEVGFNEYSTNLEVQSGDHIGVFIGQNTLRRDTSSGEGYWFKSGNHADEIGVPQTYSFTSPRNISLQGIITPQEPTGTNIQINIGDVWKEVPAMQINIGDNWKEVVGVQQNIGDSWKEVF